MEKWKSNREPGVNIVHMSEAFMAKEILQALDSGTYHDLPISVLTRKSSPLVENSRRLNLESLFMVICKTRSLLGSFSPL
jgi:hypothetical protein